MRVRKSRHFVSISHLRFFSLIVAQTNPCAASLRCFNLTLEILFTDRRYHRHNPHSYTRFNLTLEILFTDRAGSRHT